MTTEIVRVPPRQLARLGLGALPAVITDAGEDAARHFLEFFAARIRNKNTRTAYAHAAAKFLDWCDRRGLALRSIEPMAVAAYIEKLQADAAPPTVKQHLAAIRKLFDWLVIHHVIQVNPAMSVQGPKHSVIEGSTPALAVEQARALMESISTGSVAGLRDRAILGVLIYTAARVGAVSQLKVKHFRRDGHHWSLRLGEKGGKSRDIPIQHKLESYLKDYWEAVGLSAELDKNTPLFRTVNRDRRLTDKGMHRVEIHAMVKRRLKAQGFRPT